MNACMSDIMINKFTEFKLFTVVNILQKHCDLSGYTVLDGRTIQTESVAHQKNLTKPILPILFQHHPSKRNSMV